MKIGPHLSVAGGYKRAVITALELGADTFQAFSRNPRGGAAAEIDGGDISEAEVLMELNSFGPILIHGPYTLNMAAAKPESFTFAKECFADDMKRMMLLPSSLYVFHPGSKTILSYEQGITQIADTVRSGMIEGSNTYVLLETMSGKGSEIGGKFEEIKDITDFIGKFHSSDRIGVCMDTCHLYSAGYDIVNDLDGVLTKFDKIVGLDRVKAVHLNDSMYPFASNKDRHAGIGMGSIGLEAIVRIVSHPALKDKPFFLETPHEELTEYAAEMEIIRNKAALNG